MIQAIAHPTDFSAEGASAFAHALRLALLYRCRLDLLHVRSPGDEDHWGGFPPIRETLTKWGLMAPGASVDEIAAQTGVNVRKIAIRDRDAADGLSQFLLSHRPDVLVMATHGREGLNRWLVGSVSAEIAQQTHLPTLLIGPEAKAFVDATSGAFGLRNILVPVAQNPAPHRALYILAQITAAFPVAMNFVHVGDEAFQLIDHNGVAVSVRSLTGPVVETLLAEARDTNADLIAMATAGQQGFLDALRGSTTEQVVRRAPCPVLALPA